MANYAAWYAIVAAETLQDLLSPEGARAQEEEVREERVGSASVIGHGQMTTKLAVYYARLTGLQMTRGILVRDHE